MLRERFLYSYRKLTAKNARGVGSNLNVVYVRTASCMQGVYERLRSSRHVTTLPRYRSLYIIYIFMQGALLYTYIPHSSRWRELFT